MLEISSFLGGLSFRHIFAPYLDLIVTIGMLLSPSFDLRNLTKASKELVGEMLCQKYPSVNKKDANEINIKEANLAQYDVIAFATHGLMAGDFSGQVTEPALVLTPPIELFEECYQL